MTTPRDDATPDDTPGHHAERPLDPSTHGTGATRGAGDAPPEPPAPDPRAGIAREVGDIDDPDSDDDALPGHVGGGLAGG
jgi:hypothetical protein